MFNNLDFSFGFKIGFLKTTPRWAPNNLNIFFAYKRLFSELDSTYISSAANDNQESSDLPVIKSRRAC